MFAKRPRRGSAIIEVLIALVLLAISGTALITLLGQTRHSIRSFYASEQQTRGAAAELSALSILSRGELAARLGSSAFHGWSVRIEPVGTDLFDVRLAESDTSAVLLRTTLYRPDGAHDAEP